MGLIRIMERGGDDYRDYKKELKKAKKAIDALCEITEDMENEYGYSERYNERHGDYEDMEERGGKSYRRRSM